MLACERSKVNRSIWNSATIVLACAIAVIAGSMKCDAQADETDKLLADLESTDDGKQIGAALRIAELGESASGTLPGLCRALVSDNRRVRFFVALAIESLFDGEKLVKAQKALALVEQMHDESANVRFEALKATELLDESIILVGDMVRRLTADSTKLVRVRAIAVLGAASAEQEEYLELLKQELVDTNPSNRIEVIRGIGRMDQVKSNAIAVLRNSLAEDADNRVRVFCACTLADLGEDGIVALTVSMADTEDDFLLECAAEALEPHAGAAVVRVALACAAKKHVGDKGVDRIAQMLAMLEHKTVENMPRATDVKSSSVRRCIELFHQFRSGS